MSNGIIQDEASGVYVGTLQEDMIDTISREKKMYCDVLIPDFFDSSANYPLTYVPLWAMSLDLKKGDKVMVTFNQENLLHPILYKNPNEIDKGFYEKFDISKSGATSENTVCATRLGDSSYIIKTDSYTILHQNNGFIAIDKSNNVYVYGNKINIVSTSGMSIRNSSGVDLLNILKSVITTLNTKVTVAEGVVVPAQFASDLVNINSLIGQ